MGFIDGFGVNYKASQANWAIDKAYFKKNKSPNTPFGIRVHMPGLPSSGINATWNSTAYKIWRDCAAYFAGDPDFYVTWGPSFGNITETNWQSIHNAVVAEATYCQSIGLQLDDFEVGNEYEGATSPHIDSITQTGGVATAITRSDNTHIFQNGDVVTIFDANPTAWNGTYTVTRISNTQFRFTCNSSLTPTINLNARAYSMSIASLNDKIRALATACRAVYPLAKGISYGGYNLGQNGYKCFDDWCQKGLGGLDSISIHPYGGINTTDLTRYQFGIEETSRMVDVLGENRVYVSEFNLDGVGTGYPMGAAPDNLTPIWMKQMVNQLQECGIKMFMLYQYCGYLNGSNSFAGGPRTNGTMNPMWYAFFDSNARPINGRPASSARTSSTGRASSLARVPTQNRNKVYS